MIELYILLLKMRTERGNIMLLKDYLTKLKKDKDLSYDKISKLTDLPLATVKSVLTGRTQDPQLSTISKIVYAMGGSLDDIFGNKKINDKIHNADDIECLQESFKKRLREKDERIKALQRDKHIFMIVAAVLIAFIIAMFSFDVIYRVKGWIQY